MWTNVDIAVPEYEPEQTDVRIYVEASLYHNTSRLKTIVEQ
jgi:hypothetical protein